MSQRKSGFEVGGRGNTIANAAKRVSGRIVFDSSEGEDEAQATSSDSPHKSHVDRESSPLPSLPTRKKKKEAVGLDKEFAEEMRNKMGRNPSTAADGSDSKDTPTAAAGFSFLASVGRAPCPPKKLASPTSSGKGLDELRGMINSKTPTWKKSGGEEDEEAVEGRRKLHNTYLTAMKAALTRGYATEEEMELCPPLLLPHTTTTTNGSRLDDGGIAQAVEGFLTSQPAASGEGEEGAGEGQREQQQSWQRSRAHFVQLYKHLRKGALKRAREQVEREAGEAVGIGAGGSASRRHPAKGQNSNSG